MTDWEDINYWQRMIDTMIVPKKEKPQRNISTPEKKRCPLCKSMQIIDLFLSRTGKIYAYCQACRNAQSRQRYQPEKGLYSHLMRTYGLSREEYEKLLAAQGGVCACCGEKEKVINKHTGKVQRLCVDHHHASGLVRALLCDACNKLVGYVENNPTRVEKSVAYLKKWEHNNTLKGMG